MAQNRRTSITKPAYSIHPSIEHAQSIVQNLPAKTGRSIDQWGRLLKKYGPPGSKERRAWLKTEHKIGGTTAAMIADFVDGKLDSWADPKTYLKTAAAHVEAMYSGPKEPLRPIHDRLLELARALGTDVRICPCKTIVPLYRTHVFAEIKPTTRTRIDLGLALKGCTRKIPKRLIDTGGTVKGDRITHRIPVSSIDEVDSQLKQWLQIAYDLDG